MSQSLVDKGFFSRNKSGFVREFSFFDVFVFNVVGYSLGVALATNPVFIGAFAPRASIYIVLTLGATASLFNGLTYGLFAGSMPRSGGEYVFIGRTLGPGLGFVASWGFTVSQIYGLGLVTGWCITQALSPALATFGWTSGYPELVSLAQRLNEPIFVCVLGTAILLLVLLISSLGLATLKRFLVVLFFFALTGTLIMGFYFLTNTHADFVERFDSFMLRSAGVSGAYNQIIALGKQNGVPAGAATDLWESIRALPFGFLIFVGFTYSVYMGSEVREPQKSQSRGVLSALLFGYIIFMVIMGRYFAVVGRDFNSSIAIQAVVEQSKLPVGTSMAFFAGVLADSPWLNFMMNAGLFLWFFLLPFVMVQVCVRNVFAWAFDGLMPQALTRVSAQKGAPWVATIAVLCVAEIILILSVVKGIALIGAIALMSFAFLLTGLAAMAFPYRRPSLFNNAPPLVKRPFVGYPLIVCTGFISSLFCLLILYESLANPAVSGSSDRLALYIFLVVYGLGMLVYHFRRRLLNQALTKKKVDLNQLFAELPPE